MMTHDVEQQDAPTPAQWARAEALKALYLNPNRGPSSMRGVAEQVNVLAALILTGELPKAARGA